MIRTALRSSLLAAIAVSATALCLAQEMNPVAPGAVAPAAPPAPTKPVWQARLRDFSDAEYDRAVEALISNFEQSTGRRLVPGKKGRAGLKIYSDSGPGMATPVPLVRGVIAALRRRGFEN